MVRQIHLSFYPPWPDRILTNEQQKAITELNFIFVLNFLAYEADKNKRIEQARKQQERTYRIK